MGSPLYVTNYFSLTVFKIRSFFVFKLGHFNYDVYWYLTLRDGAYRWCELMTQDRDLSGHLPDLCSYATKIFSLWLLYGLNLLPSTRVPNSNPLCTLKDSTWGL